MSLKNLNGGILAAFVIGVVLLQISEANGSKLPGKYGYDSDPKCPKMDILLTKMGVKPEEKVIIRMFAMNATMEISQSGEEITLKSGIPLKFVTNTFTSGEEFDEEVHIGPKIKTTATVEGDKITFKRTLTTGEEFLDVLECTDAGCTNKLTLGQDKAEVKWKRMKE